VQASDHARAGRLSLCVAAVSIVALWVVQASSSGRGGRPGR
jgi:hypothetical protein